MDKKQSKKQLTLWKRIAVTSLLLLYLGRLAGSAMMYALLRRLLPRQAWRDKLTQHIAAIGYAYTGRNAQVYERFELTEWEVIGAADLDPNKNYLIMSNHVSAVDILAVIHALHHVAHIPIMRFFVKSNLRWVPLISAVCRAYDMPFMKRYSRAYLEKHPEKRGEDFRTAHAACNKLRGTPFSIINYVEGTRKTPAKKAKQQSPYNYLLKPKAGGMAQAIHALGDELDMLLDVTLVYSHPPSLAALLSGQIGRIVVDVKQRPIPAHFLDSDYSNDPVFKEAFHTWLNQLWVEKDALLATYAERGWAVS